jgi:hypothetical protein
MHRLYGRMTVNDKLGKRLIVDYLKVLSQTEENLAVLW